MQTLFFEKAWEKTISSLDRKKIQTAFNETQMEEDVRITYLWEAKNHEDAVLVTSLIHNHTDKPLHIKNNKIQYGTRTQCFTLAITIPAYHSMPWTFIFEGDDMDEPVDYVITVDE